MTHAEERAYWYTYIRQRRALARLKNMLPKGLIQIDTPAGKRYSWDEVHLFAAQTFIREVLYWG